MVKQYYLNRIFLYAVVAFMAGIVGALVGKMTFAWAFAGILLGLILSFIVKFRRVGICLLAFGAGIFVLLDNVVLHEQFNAYEGEIVSIGGIVEKSPLNKHYLVLKADSINGESLDPVALAVSKPYNDETLYQRGQYIVINGVLEKPMPATNPGGYDARRYWRSQGIFYQIRANKLIEIVRESEGIIHKINQWQEKLLAVLAEKLNAEHYQLMQGLLFGEKGALDEDLYSDGQKLGIAHVFAVSGLHVGFIAGGLMGILALLRLERSFWAVGMMILFLSVYCLMTDMTASALRAAVMTVMGLLAVRWLRYRDIYTIMAFAALVILLYNPFLITAVGFQLSFGSTLGLVYCYPILAEKLSFVKPKALRNVLAVSLAAQLGSMPLIAYHFYMISLFSPLVNVLVVPVIGILVPLVLLALTMALILPVFGEILFLPAEMLIYLLLKGIDGFTALWGTGHFYLGRPHWLGILLYLALLIIWRNQWLKGWSKGVRYSFSLMALAAIFFFWRPPEIISPQITYLDVGQGSSAVAELKDNRCFVFDGGLKSDVTAGYLRYRGINRIDAVVLSHNDEDHSTGIRHLLRDFQVDYFILNQNTVDDEIIVELLDLARKRKIKVLFPQKATTLKSGVDATLTLLPVGEFTKDDTNSRQLVAVFTVDDQNIIFPGDLSAKHLENLVKNLPSIDIWTVPHHGSKNSHSEYFYQKLKPKAAIISAGRNNRYGHPHQIVLDTLAKEKIPYWRTDLCGAITIRLEGEKLIVETYLSES